MTISGLRKCADHLPAQQWKILRGRRRHDDLHVVLRAKLQEALGTRRRVLGPLPFVAVRQEQHESQIRPHFTRRRDELIDHDLRAIGEIAELRLPDHELVRLRRRVAVLEAEHGGFGEHRIDDLEVGLTSLSAAAESSPESHFSRFLVVQHRVAMRKRAASDIFAGHAHAEVPDRRATHTRGSRPCPSRSAACPRPSRAGRP
jgi:hypothetical protein